MQWLEAHVVVVVMAMSLPVSTIHAQDVSEVYIPDVGVLTRAQLDQRVDELELAREEIKLAGPRAAVGVSAGLAGVGLALVAGGAFAVNLDRGLNPGTTASGTGVIVLGSALAVGSLIGLGISTARLKRKKKERRRIEAELRTLRNAAR